MGPLQSHPDLNARALVPRLRAYPQSGISGEWSVSTVRPPSQFLEYWRVIRANLAWLSALAVAGMAGGWLFASFQRPMYQARTVLDIRTLNENFLNPRGTSTGTTESVLPEAYIQTEIKILQSDSIRKRTIDRLKIPAEGTFQKPDLSFLDSMLALLQPRAVPFKDLVGDAARRVKVRNIGNTRIVEVLCEAQDGQLAASVCNTLARTYIENNLESRYNSTRETSDWLQSQLDDVRKRLTKAENELKDAGRQTDFGLASEVGGNPAQEKLRQLQAELSRSQAERITRESTYTVASSRDAASLPVEIDSGPIREYRLRLTELRRQLAEMKMTMTPEHYRVRELAMQVSEVEKALQQERNGSVNRLKADLDMALHRESMVAAAYEKQAAKVSQRDDQAVRYNMVKRDVDSERRLYETLLQKVGEVGLTAALRTSTINIVDPAVAPLRPYSPNVLANVGIGFFGGSVLGLAFALLRARADRTLSSPGEASAYLQIRELGVIPSIRNRGFRLLLRRNRGQELSAASEPEPEQESKTLFMPRIPVRSVALATWLRIPEMAEAFHGTMNSLLFAGKEGPAVRVIVITSPEAGDGKTTVATNLAIALAQIGRRVVLVDGDLRKPRLHTIFDKTADNSLAKLLDGNDPIQQRPLDQIVCETPIPNLYLLPTKPVHEGVSNRLHSSRMRDLLERLRGEFDAIIIDSPPMMHISDARVLGWLADGVLLVFRSRRTTKEAALAVHDCLMQDAIRVLGTVLNDWSPRKGESYGSYSPSFRVA